MADVDVLLSRIDTVRSRERRVAVTAGLARVLVAFFGLVAVFFVVDWALSLPRLGRLALLVAMLAVIFHEVFVYVIQEAARYLDDDAIALRVEGRHPDLNGRLISTIQLAREHEEYVGSVELIEALENDTISFTKSMNFGDIISVATLKKVILVALVVIVISTVFSAVKPDFVRALLARLALGETKYPTRSKIISVETSPALKDKVAKVARGESVTIVARVKGKYPEEGLIEFWVLADPGQVMPVTMLPGDDELEVKPVAGGGDGQVPELGEYGEKPGTNYKAYRGTIRQVMEPIGFRVKVYDDHIGPFSVQVLARPTVGSVKVTYTYPEYTGLPERSSDVGDVTALAGTHIKVEAVSNKPVRGAGIRLMKFGTDKAQDIEMEVTTKTVSGDGGEREISLLTGSFVVDRDGDYAIKITDRDGLDNPAPVHYRIDALGDTSPKVKIEKPGKDLTVTKFAAWPIRYKIRDDYGVARVSLAYQIESEPDPDEAAGDQAMVRGEVQRIDLPSPGRGKEVGAEHIFDLRALELDIEINTTLLYWIEAEDHRRVPAPNVGKSRVYRFLVIEADEKRRELYGDTGEAVRGIETIIKDQTDTRDRVRDIINRVREFLRGGD